MKQKKQLNQTSFLLLITIVLFFVMYAIGCVVFKEQGFAKTQNRSEEHTSELQSQR